MFEPSLELPLALSTAGLPESPREAIDRAHRTGLRFVQLCVTQKGMRPRELDQSARRDLMAVLRRHELNLVGLDLWIPSEHFLDDAHVSRAVDATTSAIAMAGELGRVMLSMNLPDHDAASEVIDAINREAHLHGVTIADHAAPPIARDGEAFGVGIDPPAWIANGLDPAAGVSEHPQQVVSARLCDLNTAGMRCPIGDSGGRLDVMAYRVALSVAGYQRPVVVDSRQWTEPWSGVQRSMQTWNAGMSKR